MRRLLPEPADLGADDVLEAYQLPPGRWMRVNFIASLDGVTTVAGRSKGLQQPGDLLVFRALRAQADAVMVGAGTAAAEGYGPMGDDTTVGRMRVALGRPATAPIVVVSRRASVRPDSTIVGGTSPSLLVTCEAADPDRRAALVAAGMEVLVCGEDDVDLPLTADRLAERGLAQVTCEGGPALLQSMLLAGVVDELDLSIAPAVVGGDEVGLRPDAPMPKVSLELRQVLEEDGMLFTRYAVTREV